MSVLLFINPSIKVGRMWKKYSLKIVLLAYWQ
jgi:hypothetical protein